jgi:hypothetical protein
MAIDVEELLCEWEKDSKINDSALDQTTLRTAVLHSKYLELYTVAKLKMKKKDLDLAVLKKDKWLYYNGKMTKDEMDSRGWKYDPFDGMAKPLKSDMEIYYSTDSDIVEMKMQFEYISTYVDTCKEILDTLRWRHQTIRNIIDFKKFQAGV